MAQEAVMVEGRPALKFDTGEAWSVTILDTEYQGEPAFRFGPTDVALDRYYLYVSNERVVARGAPHGDESFSYEGFDLSRKQAQADWLHQWSSGSARDAVPALLLKLPLQNHEFPIVCGRRGYFASCSDDDDLRAFMLLAINDFDKAVQEFQRMTAALRPRARPAGAQVEEPKPPPPPPAPTLALSLHPANVQVYVDDVFKGMTSAEGRLVVEGLTPGAHRLRMNLIGYTEAARTVELKPGETANIEAKLEPAGPKPLALGEIEEALTNGLPPKGITKLVNQYGVDFALTKEIEQRLREKGADSDLLVAIATNKK